MYDIKETEFIGESLPKINANFQEASDKLALAASNDAQISSLSSFFSTHSNNADLNFFSNSVNHTGNFTFTKNALFAGVDLAKVVYPVTIYFTYDYSGTSAVPNVAFKRKGLSSDSVFTTIVAPKIPTAQDVAANKKSTGMFTFVDLGYYDWQILLTNFSGGTSTATVEIKYMA